MSDDRAKVKREETGCRHGVLHRGRDGVVEFEATWAARQDDEFADDLASFSAAMGVAADFPRLSTWYHWWKGETFEEVLLVTDEVTVERFDGGETTGLDGEELASPQTSRSDGAIASSSAAINNQQDCWCRLII
jgi:hypothetical protein